MKCLVLAAGYATRLYPLTKNFPKPLLKVGEKSIIDWLLDDIEACGRINEYIVISNHKFAEVFYKWSKTKSYKIKVLDDGTESNESRLGAVKDISLAVDSLEINDDMLVIAGDNVLDFSLCRFMEYAENKKTSCVMRYYEASEEKLRKCGVLSVNEDDLVVEMEEKPAAVIFPPGGDHRRLAAGQPDGGHPVAELAELRQKRGHLHPVAAVSGFFRAAAGLRAGDRRQCRPDYLHHRGHLSV